MKTSSAKAKGRKLQQWVAQKISNVIGMRWGADQHIASREMGQAGVDIRLSPLALEKFPWSVECKRQEKFSVPIWIKQAEDNQLPNTNWLLICKRNREKPILILDMDVFFELLKLIPGDRKGLRKKIRRRN